VLVTGGAGFIGSTLVRTLLTNQRSVRVLDDFSTGTIENLAGVEALAAEHGVSFQLVECDVRDDVRVRDAVEGCSAVAHLAAVASVTRSVEDPVAANSVTHGGTVNIVRRATESLVPRVILASSCAVYGDRTDLPIAETAAPRPLSPYASAKLAAEEVCASAADAGQLTAVSLRFFNVYGPRQDPGSEYSGVLSRFLSAAASGAGVTIFGDGLQTRDFVFVDDVAAAIVSALRRPLSGHTVTNIGSGTQVSLLDMLARLEDVCGRPIERRYEPPRTGDIRRSCADPRRAAWVLGWRATTGLGAGVAQTLDWHRRRGAGRGADGA
jgi:nucleoside-diphosphate-sugar epimerase